MASTTKVPFVAPPVYDVIKEAPPVELQCNVAYGQSAAVQHPVQHVPVERPEYDPQQPARGTQGNSVPVQQVQYMPNITQPQIGAIQKPNCKSPNTFLVITMVVMIICAILNITSLSFGVPALVMALMAQFSVSAGNYPKASSRGRTAMIFTIINASYTLAWATIITGSILGSYCLGYRYRYFYFGSTSCGL